MDGKLPFLSKSYKELGLVGRISYIASAITAILAAATAIWQVLGWASNRMDIAETTALQQAESIMYMESYRIVDDPDKKERYAELQKQIERLRKELKH